MSNENISQSPALQIEECIRSKWIGCFVALAAVVLSLVQAIVYGFVSPQDRSAGAIVFSVLAVVSFSGLSLFKKTSPLAPVALMVFDFLALLFFANKIVDYFSTEFFGEMSVAKFFGQKFAYWFSTLSFIITTLISFVAMYLPQNRELKVNNAGGESNEVKEV